MEETTRTWLGGTQTRGKILDATARAALRHGLRALTVQQILDEAALSRRTFYQHFRGKEDAALALYRSVTREMLREVHRAMQKAEDTTGRVHAALQTYVRYQRQVGDLITLLTAEAADPASPLAPVRAEALNAMARLVENEVQQGLGVELDPTLYQLLLAGLERLCAFDRQGEEMRPPNFTRVLRAARGLFDATLAAAFDLPGKS